ncbi:MAG: helix-turn-helix domain-containing protein [Halobaculum sp.]
MSRERDESGQFTEVVGTDDVLAVFDEVAGPVVTSGDVANHTGCSTGTARRKLRELRAEGLVESRETGGRAVYWRIDPDPSPVDPDDPLFTDTPVFASGEGDLSQRVDEIVYGTDP